MNYEIKKEIIHRYSDRIKEFYGGESANLEVDTCKTLSDLIEELKLLNVPPVIGCYYAENGTVYRNDDDLTTIVCFLNRDTGSYMSLPKDVAEKVAEMLNNR